MGHCDLLCDRFRNHFAVKAPILDEDFIGVRACHNHADPAARYSCYFVDVRSAATPLDSLLDPFSRCLDAESAQRVAEFRVDPAVQARIDILADRANEGMLSTEESTEYESLVNVADLITILKLKVRQNLRADRE